MKVKKLIKQSMINSIEDIELINFFSAGVVLFEGKFEDVPEEYYDSKVELLSASYDRKLQIFVSKLGGYKDATNWNN